MTYPGPAKRPNLLGAGIQTPSFSEATTALPGLLRAISAAGPEARDVIRQFNRVTQARFLRLSGAARGFAARHGLAPFSAHPNARTILEDSDRTDSPVVAASCAWRARHHVSLAVAHATWPEPEDTPEAMRRWDAEYRAECRRIRIRSIGELAEALAGAV